jgi:hypothetical protein
MKTAMQDAIEHFKNINYDLVNVPIQNVPNILEQFLEKEKEQIKDAWDAGMSEGIGTMMADLDWDGEFINYYNETYTK